MIHYGSMSVLYRVPSMFIVNFSCKTIYINCYVFIKYIYSEKKSGIIFIAYWSEYFILHKGLKKSYTTDISFEIRNMRN